MRGGGMRRVPALLPLLPLLAGAACAGAPDVADPGAVRVAVAASFADAQAELARRFELETGYRVLASPAATGQLYAQIVHGAPFDVFLAADAERPRLLEESGVGVPGTRRTFALGRLVLYGPGLDSIRAGGADLLGDGFTHLALANPRTAPYGAAAESVLARLGVADEVRPRVVRGESVMQTYQFVRSGAAELGFVALGQVSDEPETARWLVPAGYHAPLRHDAVLLRRAEGSPAARAYMDFLGTAEARRVIESYGYEAADGEGG